FESAARLSEWCVALTDETWDPVSRARVMVTRGIVLARLTRHADALPCYDAALQLYEEAGDEHFAAKVRMNRVHSYSHLARYDEALRDGEICDAVFTKLGEK